ncbi:MAG: hypothetical protein E6G94_02400 [Alphaproteobacteria bacterium]|nr:MAG: hypothetical protein E6G94_02400 [Alphaproteobacteria bacterium]
MKHKIVLAWMSSLLASCGNHGTYAGGCGDLPEGWITPREGRGVLSGLNVVSVSDAGQIGWNGKAVSEQTLQEYLKLSSGMNPVPVVQIKFGPTVDCETVRRLRALMSSSLDCTYGKCAEGTGKWWLLGDVVGPGHPSEPYNPDAPAASESKQ